MARHRFHCTLRWSDMDAFGHVNNTTFFTYLEEARVDLLFVHAGDAVARERLSSGIVVARHEIDYKAPLVFRPQPVPVGSRTRSGPRLSPLSSRRDKHGSCGGS